MQIVKSFLIILTLFVCTTNLQAQGTKGKAHQKGQYFEQLATELNLSEEQATQFRALKKEMRKEFKQLRGSGDRASMKAVRTKYQTQINTLLNPAQQEQLQALKADRKGKHGHPEKRIQKYIDRMATQLDLSDAQLAEAKSMMSNYASKRQELRTNEDKAGLKALRKEQWEGIKTVLNPAQLEKWESIKTERKTNRKGKFSPEKYAKRMNRKVTLMTEQLDLSTDQTDQIRAIFEESADQKKALMENSEQANWKGFKKAIKQDINEVLTPEQAIKWATMKGERKTKFKKGRK